MKILPQERAFLGDQQQPYPSYEQAKAVIIPFGLEASVSYGGGTAQGPQAMIDASPELEMFDETFWREIYRDIGIATLESPLPAKGSLAEKLHVLENTVAQLLDDGKFPLIFGGEHSITAGAIRPFAAKYEDLHILHFDAHADLRDGYLGEAYSHAAALRRCVDDAAVAQNGQHLTLISCGIRNISAEEIPFLEENRHRIHMHWGKDRRQWKIDEIVAPLKGKPIYLTFDVDGFDASLMPATGTPEPGGLFWEDAMDIISAAARAGQIVGADVNELAPIDSMHGPNFIAAKLAYKILGYAFWGKSIA